MAHQMNVLEHHEYHDGHTPSTEEGSEECALSSSWCSKELDWRQIPEAELDEYLRKLFYIADANGDGTLQPIEFERLCHSSGLFLPEQLVIEAFEHTDANQDGEISCEEFVATFGKLLSDARPKRMPDLSFLRDESSGPTVTHLNEPCMSHLHGVSRAALSRAS